MGTLQWFWWLFGQGATTNTRSTVSAVCTCYTITADKGQRIVQNVGCPVHDTTANRGF